uniref:Hemoglobin subunit beta-3 n=1 Tax=Aquarana catesbeiana TaxID=8400 RepID=HBB3_AQUCT|nr:RecName: Full=Hemoglobin subunit beta-3; AltName: Full=Beta-3-globin; AltName: Full=Hemoglobin beta-3 chain; AltName: Full=Hemoglobin beta-III chain, larval [Aquarana catesbeiana]
MVHWTAEEKAVINSVWQKVDVEQDGHEALTRLFIVYPWTQRYFSTFGDLSSPAAIAGNPKVHAHGKKILGAIDNAIHNLDDVKGTLHDLSEEHANELHVDPENFRRLGEVLIVVLGAKLGKAFSPQVQHVWEKFIAVLVDALSHSYH